MGGKKTTLFGKIKAFFSRLRGKPTEEVRYRTLDPETKRIFDNLKQYLEEEMRNPRKDSPFEYMQQTLDEIIRGLRMERKKSKK